MTDPMQESMYDPKAIFDADADPDRELVFNRAINAPRDLVFQVWTDPNHIGAWWGPNGFTTTTHSMNAVPGGAWIYIMHGPDGTDYPNYVAYWAVEKPARLAYAHGEREGEPPHFHVEVRFEEVGGKTQLTMRMIFSSAAVRDAIVESSGGIEGAQQTLARLDAYMAEMTQTKP